MSFHYLKEDGSGALLLEDGGNAYLLEYSGTIRVRALKPGLYGSLFRQVDDVFDISGINAFASWMLDVDPATPLYSASGQPTPSPVQPLPDFGPHDGTRPGDIFSFGTWSVVNGALVDTIPPTGYSFPPKDGHS